MSMDDARWRQMEANWIWIYVKIYEKWLMNMDDSRWQEMEANQYGQR